MKSGSRPKRTYARCLCFLGGWASAAALEKMQSSSSLYLPSAPPPDERQAHSADTGYSMLCDKRPYIYIYIYIYTYIRLHIL